MYLLLIRGGKGFYILITSVLLTDRFCRICLEENLKEDLIKWRRVPIQCFLYCLPARRFLQLVLFLEESHTAPTEFGF